MIVGRMHADCRAGGVTGGSNWGPADGREQQFVPGIGLCFWPGHNVCT